MSNTNSAAELSDSEFRVLIDAATELAIRESEKKKSQDLKQFEPDSLLWLLSAPFWDVELAQLCGFPFTLSNPLAEFEALEIAGFCKQTESESEFRFWVSENARRLIMIHLDEYFQGDTAERLKVLTEKVGLKVLESHDSESASIRQLQKWAVLATSSTKAQCLNSVVEKSLQSNEVSKAIEWIAAARVLSGVFGEEFLVPSELAAYSVELYHRKFSESNYLKKYLTRFDLENKFENLLSNSSDKWVLHYKGPGGVGKTMLLRHCVRLARSKNIPVARIDFDFINPDYPSKAPGLLLQHISEELKLYSENDESKQKFAMFEDKMKALHKRYSADWMSIRHDLSQDPEFLGCLFLFIEALNSLPNSCIAIFLDTCEELAKLKADGSVPENVTVTMQMLETLRKKVGIKVIFAGRRSLAFPFRPEEFEICSVFGFSEHEAQDYLKRHEKITCSKTRKRLIQAAMEPPIDSSCDTATRANPFDLALLSRWAKDDFADSLDGEISRFDHYIEIRIIQRIQNPVLRKILPGLVAIGRVNRQIIKYLITSEDGDSYHPNLADNIYLELSTLEWIEREKDSDFIQVTPRMVSRLTSYFERIEHGRWRLETNRVANFLKKHVLAAEFKHVDSSHLLPILRFSSFDDNLTAFWDVVEGKIAHESEYKRALQIIDRIENSEQLPEATLNLLQFTKCSIQIQLGNKADFAAISRVKLAAELAQRVKLAELRDLVRETIDASGLMDLWNSFNRVLRNALTKTEICPKVLSSFVATFELLTEKTEELRETGRFKVAKIKNFEALIARIEPRSEQAFAHVLVARCERILGRADSMAISFGKALSAMKASKTAESVSILDDWQRPQSIPIRITLEYIRANYPKFKSADDVLKKLETQYLPLFSSQLQSPSFHSVDIDLLRSALLQLYCATASLSFYGVSKVEQLVKFIRYSPLSLSKSTCNASNEFLNSKVAVARELARAGHITQALDDIQAIISFSENQATLESKTFTEAQIAESEIFQRFRISRSSSAELSRASNAQIEIAIQTTKALVDPISSYRDYAFESLGLGTMSKLHQKFQHYYFPNSAKLRSKQLANLDRQLKRQIGISPASRHGYEQLLKSISEPSRETLSADKISLYFDGIELAILSGNKRPHKFYSAHDFTVAMERKTEYSPDFASLILRGCAILEIDLSDYAKGERDLYRQLVQRIGRRECADIARDIADLMSLRLPAHAKSLYEQSAVWSGAAADHLSALMTQTSAALCCLRVNDWKEFVRTTEELPRLIRKACKQDRSLGVLERAVQSNDSIFSDPDWKFWLLRIRCCLLKAKQIPDSGVTPAELIASAYPNTPAQRWPIDLQGFHQPKNSNPDELDSADFLFSVHTIRSQGVELAEIEIRSAKDRDEQRRRLILQNKILCKLESTEITSLLRDATSLDLSVYKTPFLLIRCDLASSWIPWEAVGLGHQTALVRSSLDSENNSLKFDWRRLETVTLANLQMDSMTRHVWHTAGYSSFSERGQCDILHVSGNPVPTATGYALVTGKQKFVPRQLHEFFGKPKVIIIEASDSKLSPSLEFQRLSGLRYYAAQLSGYAPLVIAVSGPAANVKEIRMFLIESFRRSDALSRNIISAIATGQASSRANLVVYAAKSLFRQ